MPQREATVLGARGAQDSSATDLDRIIFVKAVVNGKIIGSIRGYAMDGSAYLSRLNVHPYFRGRGIGRRLLEEIEQVFPHVNRFEIKTGHRSKRNLFQLAKRGFEAFKTEPFTPIITWVYLQKYQRPPSAKKMGTPGEGTRPTSPEKPPSCRPGALTRRE
ncbi:MAG: GNAT family N-acetyltransferase [Verrucomicrobiota bacterium]